MPRRFSLDRDDRTAGSSTPAAAISRISALTLIHPPSSRT
jgi:hypothetical protein